MTTAIYGQNSLYYNNDGEVPGQNYGQIECQSRSSSASRSNSRSQSSSRSGTRSSSRSGSRFGSRSQSASQSSSKSSSRSSSQSTSRIQTATSGEQVITSTRRGISVSTTENAGTQTTVIGEHETIMVSFELPIKGGLAIPSA